MRARQIACTSTRNLVRRSVTEAGGPEPVSGTTLGGLVTRGEQRLWHVVDATGAEHMVASITWHGGEREVCGSGCALTPTPSVASAFRLAVDPLGEGYSVVDLDAPLGPRRPLGVGDPQHLASASEPCLRCALDAAGAVGVGTRQELLAAAGGDRHGLCAVFPEGVGRVPVVAYVLTRLDLWRRRPRGVHEPA